TPAAPWLRARSGSAFVARPGRGRPSGAWLGRRPRVAATRERALRLLSVDPIRQNFPVGVVLGRELAPAGVKDVAARLGRERLLQQTAGRGIARVHQDRRHLEVLARLLLAPGAGAGGEPFQPERV